MDKRTRRPLDKGIIKNEKPSAKVFIPWSSKAAVTQSGEAKSKLLTNKNLLGTSQ